VDEHASKMEDRGTRPDEPVKRYWLAAPLPFALRQRVETVFEVLSHLPLEQPLAVVSDAGRTVAVNAPLLELMGDAGPSLIGRQWSSVMPGWTDRARGFSRQGEQVFEEHLLRTDGRQVWVRVSLGPVAERDERRAMAYLLFISKPDVETVDHEEVRRLRKSLHLLAETQTDLVVEVDRDGLMTFVSPSLCRAIGASEKELLGTRFIGRVRAQDRAAVAAALDAALKPPFAGEVTATLAAGGAALAWQLDAVIGDGIVGLDLVGRALAGAGVAAPPKPTTSPDRRLDGQDRARPSARTDARLDSIRERLNALRPGDQSSLMLLAKAVGDVAHAECVLYRVKHGDVEETAIGWRLPSSA
jgi:PAS domain S-box-containing protein